MPVCASLAVAITSGTAGWAKATPTKFLFTQAIACADIQYKEKPTGKKISVPLKVKETVEAAVKSMMQKNTDFASLVENNGDAISFETFELPGPAPSISLFACLLDEEPGYCVAFLSLFDHTNNRVTSTPPAIDFKWQNKIDDVQKDGFVMRQYFKQPYTSFGYLDDKSKPVLIFKRIAHNGTMINSVDTEFFEIGTDLSLHRDFSCETEFQLIEDGATIRGKREIALIEKGRIRITTIAMPEHKPERELGSVVLKRNATGTNFIVDDKVVNEKAYADLIDAYDASWSRGTY